MGLSELDRSLVEEVETLQAEGRAKPPERVIVEYIPPRGEKGPRYRLAGSDREFVRMNSNSYLSLSNHPALIEAADAATRQFGVGPGAVRFIDGTFSYHVTLEERIARFVGKPAAKIFNSAYTANCGFALAVSHPQTYWIGDQLNHNSIIRAMRIANVPGAHRGIYDHNNMEALQRCLDAVPAGVERVVIIFDGVFSMRGDCAPMAEIQKIAQISDRRFKDGVITVVDDSHGIGAFGETGRGTAEFTGAQPEVIIGTFGKAFGVNGGFIVGSQALVEAIRQKADTYIYTNPLGVGDCAAAIQAIEICDSPEGRQRLRDLQETIRRFRHGIAALGLESIPGPHPVVPVLVRDTAKTHQLVEHLFARGILVAGLTYPVVPRGNETIRFQVNAAHTGADIDEVLEALSAFTISKRATNSSR
ncbi:MAG TPA: aminotransferase class I/II-fold pyridoxal phosphate-dependent enzyme [Candidatus Methylomirabilis sp.]|nr:aminotransferase class I/II-fold pyridoxal phosphate-dependent enzyme [Candidatus Methylomirabilis sp.]